jgi:hypothetical protein
MKVSTSLTRLSIDNPCGKSAVAEEDREDVVFVMGHEFSIKMWAPHQAMGKRNPQRKNIYFYLYL